jgi:CubicO group peptidase (beta-lactamase class C family)
MQRPTISFNESDGWGLAGSVRIDLAKGNSLGSVGEFGWAGAASTWFRVDPKEKLVMVIFQQKIPIDGATAQRFSNLVYQSLAD